jgi:hypothetical protein
MGTPERVSDTFDAVLRTEETESLGTSSALTLGLTPDCGAMLLTELSTGMMSSTSSSQSHVVAVRAADPVPCCTPLMFQMIKFPFDVLADGVLVVER